MHRKIVQPADLSGAALEELKDWLSITRNTEDAMLEGMLHASLALCEAFTGQMAVEQIVQERNTARSGIVQLSARPVRFLVSMAKVQASGVPVSLLPDEYELSLSDDAVGSVRIKMASGSLAYETETVAGIAANWETAPQALKQGIIRMAAHLYRDRDSASSKAMPPPASVTALWKPWRTMRLA